MQGTSNQVPVAGVGGCGCGCGCECEWEKREPSAKHKQMGAGESHLLGTSNGVLVAAACECGRGCETRGHPPLRALSCGGCSAHVPRYPRAYPLHNPAQVQVVNRWLSVRLELMGAAVVFSAAFFVTAVLPRSPGMVGLVVSAALNLTGTMNWLVRQVTELEVNMNSVSEGAVGKELCVGQWGRGCVSGFGEEVARPAGTIARYIDVLETHF
eukprot:360476-Chlamydomonas_euryale.AAC.6